MTQTVVQNFGWVTTAQMIDALGLAETTPGPLILVTQFVAMLVGHQAGGAGLAIAAGLIALWAIFVPCFLWVFVAGPYLDEIAMRPRLDSALKGITAAVFGVILSLALWFALNITFDHVPTLHFGPASLPRPDIASINVDALLLMLVAAGLMVWRKLGLTRVLPLMSAIGAVLGQF